jgi:Tol biopolymer transport system component
MDEYYVVDAVADATPVKVKNVPVGDAYAASISPNGQKIAYDANGYVYVSDINGDNRIRVSTLNGEMGDNYFPIFNKDGDKVIFITGFPISPVKLIAAPIRENGAAEGVVISDLSAAGLGFTTDFILSGDGQHIYLVGYGDNTGCIYKIPTSGGAPFKLFSGVGDKTWKIAGMHFVEE